MNSSLLGSRMLNPKIKYILRRRRIDGVAMTMAWPI
jgi:hypothetical protein